MSFLYILYKYDFLSDILAPQKKTFKYKDMLIYEAYLFSILNFQC
jgi:hypothetical protein